MNSLPKFFQTLSPLKSTDEHLLFHDEMFGNFPVEMFAWPSPNLSTCKDSALYLYDNYLVAKRRIPSKDLESTLELWQKTWLCMDCEHVEITPCSEPDFSMIQLQIHRPLCSLFDLVTFLRLFYGSNVALPQLATRIHHLLEDFVYRCNKAVPSLKLEVNNVQLTSLVVCVKVWERTPRDWHEWLDCVDLRFALPWSSTVVTSKSDVVVSVNDTWVASMFEMANVRLPSESPKRIENALLVPPFVEAMQVSVLLAQLVAVTRLELNMELQDLGRVSIANSRWWYNNIYCTPRAICTMFLEVCIKMNAKIPTCARNEIYEVTYETTPPTPSTQTPTQSQSQTPTQTPTPTPLLTKRPAEVPALSPPPTKRLKATVKPDKPADVAVAAAAKPRSKPKKRKDPCPTCGNPSVISREGHDRKKCNQCVFNRDARQVVFRVPSIEPVVQTNLQVVESTPKWSCDWCHTVETVKTRNGPRGKHTLCNLCGVVYWKGNVRKKNPQAKPEYEEDEGDDFEHGQDDDEE